MGYEQFVAHGTAAVSPGPPVSVATSDPQWSFAASLPVTAIPGWDAVEDDCSRVLLVEMSVRQGRVGLGLVGPTYASFLCGEVARERGNEAAVLLEVPAGIRPAALVVRRLDGEPAGSADCLITSVRAVPATVVDPRALRQAVVDRFSDSYRHYTFDLGEGVVLRASRPSIMPAHELNHRLALDLATNAFGDLRGRRVLDAGCSSGFHSFGFALGGADVVGIDVDEVGIAQAHAVLEHAPWLGSVRAAGNCRFEVADITRYAQASDRKHEIVFCMGVLYHLRSIIDGLDALAALTTRGMILRSFVTEGHDLTLTLADSRKYCFCYEGELSFVPTVALVEHLCRRVGFRAVQTYRPSALTSAERIASLDPLDREAWLRHGIFVVASR
jgi:SAM-dependent methyltransferase